MKHIPYREYPSPLHAHLAENLAKAQNILVHYFKYLPPHAAGVYLNVVANLFAKDITPQNAFRVVEEALLRPSENTVNIERGDSDEI